MEAQEWCRETNLPPPSESGWFRFLARERWKEREGIVFAVESSGEMAKELAKYAVDDDTAARAFKGRAIDAAMADDDRSAALYASAANAFRDRAQKAKELALKEAAQKTREDALRLARERFEAAEKRENAAKAALGDTKLTDAERLERMKEIFGIHA